MKKLLFPLLFFLSACQTSKPTELITFDQPLMDGRLVYGRIKPNHQLFIANADRRIGEKTGLFEIPTDKGHFVLGIPQDANDLKLTLKTQAGLKNYDFPVQKRLWKEDIVNGLPPKKVIPPQEEQDRILSEILLMREKRKVSDYPQLARKWTLPVQNFTRVSSPFGARRVLNGTLTQGHSGTDYAAPEGTPVLAAADGKVVLTHPDMFYTGATVLIDHGSGIYTTYCHLSRIDVKPGQSVKSGEMIAAVGSTGRATGPHLHFGLSWYGVRLNPEDLF
ncbi:MAG: M23 family metallopeptidase [Alphaproteobacteria bacterium]